MTSTGERESEGPQVEWVLEHGMDLPLGQLYPALLECGDQEVTSAGMPRRLQNVLSRWRGLAWGRYLEVTPRQLLERRNAGLGSLAAMLRIAAATRRDFSVDAVSDNSVTATDGAVDQAPPQLEASDAGPVAALLRPIVAWGALERGRLDLADILNTAQGDNSTPEEITEALSQLRSLDWTAWASPLAPRFDPWVPIRDFVARLEDQDRTLVRERLVTLERPATLQELARRRKITRERVRQIESKLAKRLRSETADSRSALGRSVKRVRAGLGLAMQVGHAEASGVLEELRVASLMDLETLLLLWLAGPYQITGEWLVRRPTQKAVEETQLTLRTITSNGPAPVADAEDALEARGVVRTEIREWIVSVGGFRIHEEQLVRWGGSMADKAEVVLRLSGTPLSREALAIRLGPGTNWRSMANQLFEDSRFKRTGILHFGLAEWDHDEYTGVADEIAQEIERKGGEATLDHLVSFVSGTYGVSESSVRAYASGPRFERAASGALRLRTESPARSGSRPIETTKGAFVMQGRWALRIRVNDQHLRGSGFPIPESVARAFGLEPLGALELDSAWGGIRMGWPSLSPHIGSIRPALEAMGAAEGDLVFLVASDGALDFRYVERSTLEGSSGLDRLVAEVGGQKTDGDALTVIARALAIDESSTEATVARRLRARGEDELASLATQQDDDGPLVLSLRASRFVEFKLSR